MYILVCVQCNQVEPGGELTVQVLLALVGLVRFVFKLSFDTKRLRSRLSSDLALVRVVIIVIITTIVASNMNMNI